LSYKNLDQNCQNENQIFQNDLKLEENGLETKKKNQDYNFAIFENESSSSRKSNEFKENWTLLHQSIISNVNKLCQVNFPIIRHR